MGEAPAERFAKEEAGRLKPLAGRPPFGSCRTLERKVGNDCAVEVDGNAYSAPWRLIGERVEATVAAGEVRLRHGTKEVAVHKLAEGRRQRVIDPAHLAGLAGAAGGPRRLPQGQPARRRSALKLLRPLSEYEALVGGGFDGSREETGAGPRSARTMLTRLQLTAIRDQLDSLLDEAARADLSSRETLALLLEREIARKDHRRIDMALKLAHFPAIKDLQSFDFEAQPSIDPRQIRDLAAGRFIANGENVLLLGPPG